PARGDPRRLGCDPHRAGAAVTGRAEALAALAQRVFFGDEDRRPLSASAGDRAIRVAGYRCVALSVFDHRLSEAEARDALLFEDDYREAGRLADWERIAASF